MIKWLFIGFRGKPVPKYLSGKKESLMILNAPWDELYGYPKPPNLPTRRQRLGNSLIHFLGDICSNATCADAVEIKPWLILR